ncbi:hypothetical protein [Vibrio navarrensis]|uniref:hypothetical protein n=1 Tax=Vibrio navarrensis TaxID=29495 RepID=UPI00051CF35D|nr:hypothetical protein [Vibrio navarrensis]KGK08514.1 hypothetical protein EA24_02675 [Vibrio navarrensis]
MIAEVVGNLVGLILAHSIFIGSDLQEGELMVPRVIYYENSVRKMEVFEAETQVDAVANAELFIKNLPQEVDSWAYAQDGLVTLTSGEKQDVYYIKAWSRGMLAPLELYQPYTFSPFSLDGNIKVLNYEASGLDMREENAFIRAIQEGAFAHPAAPKALLERWFGNVT